VTYPGIGEAPPLPSLSIVENEGSSFDRPEVEVQLEEERLNTILSQKNIISFEQFSSSSTFINLNIVIKAHVKAKLKAMAYPAQPMIPIFEGDEDPRRH